MGIRDKWPETFFSSLLKAAPFPEIKSTHSLVAKHVTPEKWEKLAEHKTATSGFTLAQVSVCDIFEWMNDQANWHGNSNLIQQQRTPYLCSFHQVSFSTYFCTTQWNIIGFLCCMIELHNFIPIKLLFKWKSYL